MNDTSSYQLMVNNQYSFDINEADLQNLDLIETPERQYHLINQHQTYAIEVLNIDINTKLVELSINGKIMSVQINDHFDRLIKKMGLSAGGSQKVNTINAPMPGLVLDILVEEGQTIQKGDALLILEAMKMENVIKAPNDAIIKSIHIEKNNTVEKGELMIHLE